MGHFVEHVEGRIDEAAFAISIHEGVRQRPGLMKAEFEYLRVKLLNIVWRFARGTELELLKIVRDEHSSSLVFLDICKRNRELFSSLLSFGILVFF